MADDERPIMISARKNPIGEAAEFKTFVPRKREQFRGQQRDNNTQRIAKCTFCGREGHTRDGCFKRIGYPEWWPGDLTKDGTPPVANMGGKYNVNDEWIVDSGATEHITCRTDLLENKRKNNYETPVIIPNGDRVPVEGRGDYTMPSGDKIKEGLRSRNLIGAGECKKGLYRMGLFGVERKAMATTVDVWHKRLGHASESKLAQVDFLKNVSFKKAEELTTS
ncbi:hypothetical protein SSX86_022824 [Deinandra increscens subsp. villosa]|uniref:Retrovirus-related Pol polyprotein from transposon TNT 1-94-like beta-barrel domain-containing protein n=1 Tax=Deinandra increscens subsp. villosa TaxID=3103831 RepID=A0AAP0CRG8_9ASTR